MVFRRTLTTVCCFVFWTISHLTQQDPFEKDAVYELTRKAMDCETKPEMRTDLVPGVPQPEGHVGLAVKHLMR
jgi:hypothetical protein